MEGTSIDPASKVHVYIIVLNQDFGNVKLFLTNREAKRRARVFVQNVRISKFVFEQTFEHSNVTFGRTIMERGPQTIVNMVHIKNVIRVVFQKIDDIALLLIMLDQELAQIGQAAEDDPTF